MILKDILAKNLKTISLIGMDKNAGKTVVLNQLMEDAYDEDVRIGITSIGRDGERRDIVTMTDKPMIYAYEGTLIATAEKIFNLSEAGMEILEITNINTSMGKIIIANVKHEGYVQIAGPASNRDIKLVSDKMLSLGASLVFIDGALDRVSTASPAIAEAAVLSTGAVLSRDMNKVVDLTCHRVDLFKLDEVEHEVIREIAKQAFEDRKTLNVRIVEDDISYIDVDIKTALGAGKIIAEKIDDHTKYVIFHGSLVYSTLRDIVSSTRNVKNINFVVRDATKIFIDKKDYNFIVKKGIKILVYNKVNLLAVTINPFSPAGYFFNPEEFRSKLEASLPCIPVVDVVNGG